MQYATGNTCKAIFFIKKKHRNKDIFIERKFRLNHFFFVIGQELNTHLHKRRILSFKVLHVSKLLHYSEGYKNVVYLLYV